MLYAMPMKLGMYCRLLARMILIVRNWPVYWLNRFGMTKGNVVYKLRNGMTITSRRFSVDGGALNDVWFDESYEANNFGVALDWQACRTILDIGANIGTFTAYAAYRAPNARIVSVEPEPGNLAMLTQNVAANALQGRVTIVPAAMGGTNGTVTLHATDKSSGGHSLYHRYGNTHDVSVPMIALGTLLEQQGIDRCDYLKLDCEGGEYEALYSLRADQLQRIQFLAVEYHHFSSDPRHTPDRLRAYLQEHGFRITAGKKSMFFAKR